MKLILSRSVASSQSCNGRRVICTINSKFSCKVRSPALSHQYLSTTKHAANLSRTRTRTGGDRRQSDKIVSPSISASAEATDVPHSGFELQIDEHPCHWDQKHWCYLGNVRIGCFRSSGNFAIWAVRLDLISNALDNARFDFEGAFGEFVSPNRSVDSDVSPSACFYGAPDVITRSDVAAPADSPPGHRTIHAEMRLRKPAERSRQN